MGCARRYGPGWTERESCVSTATAATKLALLLNNAQITLRAVFNVLARKYRARNFHLAKARLKL
jgi:hypothetical protein